MENSKVSYIEEEIQAVGEVTQSGLAGFGNDVYGIRKRDKKPGKQIT